MTEVFPMGFLWFSCASVYDAESRQIPDQQDGNSEKPGGKFPAAPKAGNVVDHSHGSFLGCIKSAVITGHFGPAKTID